MSYLLKSILRFHKIITLKKKKKQIKLGLYGLERMSECA